MDGNRARRSPSPATTSRAHCGNSPRCTRLLCGRAVAQVACGVHPRIQQRQSEDEHGHHEVGVKRHRPDPLPDLWSEPDVEQRSALEWRSRARPARSAPTREPLEPPAGLGHHALSLRHQRKNRGRQQHLIVGREHRNDHHRQRQHQPSARPKAGLVAGSRARPPDADGAGKHADASRVRPAMDPNNTDQHRLILRVLVILPNRLERTCAATRATPVALRPEASSMTSPNPNTKRRRERHSLPAHSSNHSTSGHASCGLMVASASRPPAQKSHPPARHAPQPASNPATSKLSCCSLIPCTMGNQPTMSTIKISAGPQRSLQRKTRSQSKTLTAASPTNSHRKPIWTTSKGRSTVGASRNTTYAG